MCLHMSVCADFSCKGLVPISWPVPGLVATAQQPKGDFTLTAHTRVWTACNVCWLALDPAGSYFGGTLYLMTFLAGF